MLQQNLFQRVVSLVSPHMEQPENRQKLVLAALASCPLPAGIDWAGAATPFTERLVRVLLGGGECRPGVPTLVVLLKYLEEIAIGTATHRDYRTIMRELERVLDRAAFKPGMWINGFQLAREIGNGGNGTVWLVMQQMGGEQYPAAVKLLHRKHSGDPERVQRFQTEMATLSQLRDHDHIVTVYNADSYHVEGETDPRLYILMQYIDGRSLSEVTRDRPHSLEQVVKWLRQVASALDFAHTRQKPIVHRDIKPDNILHRLEDGRLFLADFGLVFSDADGEMRITQQGASVGTTYYMAPEQVDESHGEITPATDIYALGIVAYELLTGRVPFQGSKQAIKEAHRYQELPAHERLPVEVLRVLHRATAKAPADRYQSAGAFVAALGGWDADPENLAKLVEQYTAEVRKLTHADLLERLFVQEAGDRRMLDVPRVVEVEAAGDTEFLDYDLDALVKMQTQSVEPAEHKGAKDAEQHERNVRDYLLTRAERCVLLGEPGSGKTWTMILTTLGYCEAWQLDDPNTRVPVLVKLNRFKGVDVTTGEPQTFADFVRGAAGVLAPYLNRLMNERRLVLLCDALNEMPRTDPDGRDLLAEVQAYLQGAPYFVVSCRYNDYNNDLRALHPLERVRLRDLDLPAIRQFIYNYLPPEQAAQLWADMGGNNELLRLWNAAQQMDKTDRFWDVRSTMPWQTVHPNGDKLWQKMHAGAGLIPLCRKPYMGFLLTDLYRDTGRIPVNRSTLFAGFIDKLLTREYTRAQRQGKDFPPFEDISQALTKLAWALQKDKATNLPSDRLPETLRHGPGRALLHVAEEASILTYDGANWTFTHQLLQEYFAARILLNAMERSADPAAIIGGNWWEPGVWRETAVILGEVAEPNEVALWLAPFSPELARIVISENAEFRQGGMGIMGIARRIIIEQAQMKATTTDLVERSAAFRVLGHPEIDGDDRDGVGVGEDDSLPEIDWADPVPVMSYPLGGDHEAQYPLPPLMFLPGAAFRLARYPVTEGQFRAFANAADVERHDWWLDMPVERTGRDLIDLSGMYLTNYPARRVSWYQAVAFCRWLTHHYDRAGLLPYGMIVRLPHEYEWEAAARGPDGLAFPYGNTFDPAKGNTSQTPTVSRGACAVGIFPEGVAGCGALDMPGNVWEWCLNKISTPEAIDVDKSGNTRARRGGSFLAIGINSRAASRGDSLPEAQHRSGGFRVCLGPPVPTFTTHIRQISQQNSNGIPPA